MATTKLSLFDPASYLDLALISSESRGPVLHSFHAVLFKMVVTVNAFVALTFSSFLPPLDHPKIRLD